MTENKTPKFSQKYLVGKTKTELAKGPVFSHERNYINKKNVDIYRLLENHIRRSPELGPHQPPINFQACKRNKDLMSVNQDWIRVKVANFMVGFFMN
ncbi:hypothetical protein RclHR1_01800001 [Rhizophagus clarus]|uniref:Uncharacterized protein n=1 Tax=Rhizophagus clarus TaxID=94130 RepID=A0A2Z6REA9_9GLOM|nr:hypothetical protein RclHR1_01800001 [Rhizophagus clarus]GES89107.1 hypothetical protein RCL_jg17050.t1 [Rhizophagus clarus]